jgi:dienelactone hydrolase
MGGTFSLETARRCAESVSFHGVLQTQRPAAAGQVEAKMLVCTGNDDPCVPAEQITALIEEMNKTGADWHIINYGGTVHSFTNPDTDSSAIRRSNTINYRTSDRGKR